MQQVSFNDGKRPKKAFAEAMDCFCGCPNATLDITYPIFSADASRRVSQGSSAALQASATPDEPTMGLQLAPIPTATWSLASGYAPLPRAFQPSADYIPYVPSHMSGTDEEYEMDSEDDTFLRQHRDVLISDTTLIRLIRLLDRCYVEEASNSLESPEDDDCCVICGQEETYESNEMVYCDCCNIAVHQKCYGIIVIPRGSWFCLKCTSSSSRTIRCEFCPSRTGAFKRTERGNWGHVVCAHWIPELGFGNADFVDVITGEGRLAAARPRPRGCVVCEADEGATLGCAAPGCGAAYHVTCAIARGLVLWIAYEDGLPPE